MKLIARIRALYERLYETCMSSLSRLDPKSLKRAQDKPWKVPWEPGSLRNHCPYCAWRFMLWDEEVYAWQCPSCGQRCHPRLVITEKRPVVQPVQALVPMPGIERHTDPIEKQPKPAFAKGQFSFLHRREEIVNGTERLPNGLPRLAYRNGERIDTEQLQPITPEIQARFYDTRRRLG